MPGAIAPSLFPFEPSNGPVFLESTISAPFSSLLFRRPSSIYLLTGRALRLNKRPGLIIDRPPVIRGGGRAIEAEFQLYRASKDKLEEARGTSDGFLRCHLFLRKQNADYRKGWGNFNDVGRDDVTTVQAAQDGLQFACRLTWTCINVCSAGHGADTTSITHRGQSCTYLQSRGYRSQARTRGRSS